MPTTVSQLFEYAGLSLDGQVQWGQPIDSQKSGLYVVALTNNSRRLVCREKPIFDDETIQRWIDFIGARGKQILVDGEEAAVETIKERLERFWLPDETIVYIGQTGGPDSNRTLHTRVNEYYKTQLGKTSNHGGGHWINTLADLESFYVFYAEYDGSDIENKKEQLISFFMKNVSETSRNRLLDPVNCFPFAIKRVELERNRRIKSHGLSNQTE